MSDQPGHESAIDGLLLALATQAYESDQHQFSPAVLEELVDRSRSTILLLLGSIAHLVHYDSTGADDAYARLEKLFEQLVVSLRNRHPERHGLRPGDVVELAVARPDCHLAAGTTQRVYWVGDDGTVDLGYESLAEEYVISTVHISDVRKRVSGHRA